MQFFFLSLTVRPLEVRILSSRQPMSANKKYELTCQTFGSRPSATVTWWKDGVLMRRSQETVNLHPQFFKIKILILFKFYFN